MAQYSMHVVDSESPLVGSHGAAGLVRLIVTLMPPALLLPHAGPASSEHHAIALQPVGARQAGRAGRVSRGLTITN